MKVLSHEKDRWANRSDSVIEYRGEEYRLQAEQIDETTVHCILEPEYGEEIEFDVGELIYTERVDGPDRLRVNDGNPDYPMTRSEVETYFRFARQLEPGLRGIKYTGTTADELWDIEEL